MAPPGPARHELDRVRGTFSRYVAPAVVDMLLARKDERLFTGRAVRATILVCRIRDFALFTETSFERAPKRVGVLLR